MGILVLALAAVDRPSRTAGIDLAAGARRAVATRASRTWSANCADGAAVNVEQARILARGGSRRIAVAVASVTALLLTVRQVPVAPPTTPTPVVVAPPPAAAPMVVSLRHDDGTTAYTATVDPAHGTVVLVPVRLEGDPTLSPELWLIPEGDKPHSLGMIRRDAAMVVNIPANLRSAANANGLLAISLEPAGSQAHEAPTGPVVAKGNVVRL